MTALCGFALVFVVYLVCGGPVCSNCMTIKKGRRCHECGKK